MPNHVINLIKRSFQAKNKELKDSAIAILGTAYKANVSDTRFSPAKEIIEKLLDLGCKIKVNDPNIESGFGGMYSKNVLGTVENSDLMVILADHDEYGELDLKALKEIMNEEPILVDTKRIFDKHEADDAGFLYVSVGYHNLKEN